MLIASAMIAMTGMFFQAATTHPQVIGTHVEGVSIVRKFDKGILTLRLVNSGPDSKVDEVRFPIQVIDKDASPGLASEINQKPFEPETEIYGEGFTMLSQTGGTLGKPKDIGAYTDHGHYRMPAAPGAVTVYNMVTWKRPGDAETYLFGFSTCRRFSGHFNVYPENVVIVVDTEGLTLHHGEEWQLEDLYLSHGNLSEILDSFGNLLAKSAGKLRFRKPPTGWCSWQCFGPSVTEADVAANVEAIKKSGVGLKYVQIDDGYQDKTGDWLITGKSFGGGVQNVLHKIKEAGLEPAIWVAPFVATEDSQLFQNHPDWFVMDGAGKPLRSDKVTFGGWHKLPWYVLDGTNPGAQKYLETVFRTMRKEWGCTYFKLDAITWGAIKGGHFHNPNATRVEAYHQGMAAIRRGAGNAFLLGCNHPVWPSIGYIDGQRSGMDIDRSWDSFSSTARENLYRAWQNGKLWWNDPDTLLLTGNLTEDEFLFHASVILATGGLALSGDDFPKLSPAQIDRLKKLLPPTGVACKFEGYGHEVGTCTINGEKRVFLFNDTDQPVQRRFQMLRRAKLVNFWTGEQYGEKEGEVEWTLPKHSAVVLTYR